MNYTNELRAQQIKNPNNRAEELKPMIEGMCGKASRPTTFRKEDVIAIARHARQSYRPLRFSIAAAAGIAVMNVVTTVLMPMDEGVKALKKASTVRYAPPPQ